MSRFKNYSRTVLSSYLLLAVNVLTTFLSVPIALKFLGKAEFGLWALTTQIAGYLAMLDLGMRASVARHLVDHKDHQSDGHYGSVIKTGSVVGIIQGVLVMSVGLGTLWFMPSWFRVPEQLSTPFLWLMASQLVTAAASFVTRLPSQILTAWQRGDVSNYLSVVQLLLTIGVMWIGFALGWGLYSVMISSLLAWVWSAISGWLACRKLRLWPMIGAWGEFSRHQFRELFSFGTDLFIISLGTQLILYSQTILATRSLGVETAAVWFVMIKMFTMVTQLLFGTIGNSMSAFAEMQTRGEEKLFWNRYQTLFVVMSVGGVIVALLFAGCNSAFVHLWTNGKMTWSLTNDFFLAAWLFVLAQQGCHCSILVCRKDIQLLKFVFLVEGLVFITTAVFTLPRYGLTGMMFCSLLANISCTYAYSLFRVNTLLRSRTGESLWAWHIPMLKTLATLLPVLLSSIYLFKLCTPLTRLVGVSALLLLISPVVILKLALPKQITTELIRKIPEPIKGWIYSWLKLDTVCDS